MTRRILVVDDLAESRAHLCELLKLDGFEVEAACDVASATEALRSQPFHLLVTDLYMPDPDDGLALLRTVRAERMPMGVIVLTGFGDLGVALGAMKAGADDFVQKPCEPERFRHLVERVLERRRLMDELEGLRSRMRQRYSFHEMVSNSPLMRKVFDLIEQVGPLGSTVLVRGETGTGKELVANALHTADRRRRGPFVAMNCAALADSLLENELFGHEQGAYCGAHAQAKGKFEQADGGTLFLDEIGDISPAMQVKLLRVLQDGTFERVGGVKTVRVDVRIVAATHKDLEAEVKAGRFRADLFFRLNVIRIDLPPLRERREDIPILAMHFLDRLKDKSTPPVTEIDAGAMQALVSHPWPGNVRELENAIKAAVALADGTVIHRECLPATVAPRPGRRPASETLIDIDRPLQELTEELIGRVEREYFAQLLARYRGNVTQCAEHSGLSRRSVTQKLQKYALDRLDFRTRPAAGA